MCRPNAVAALNPVLAGNVGQQPSPLKTEIHESCKIVFFFLSILVHVVLIWLCETCCLAAYLYERCYMNNIEFSCCGHVGNVMERNKYREENCCLKKLSTTN